MRGRRGKGTIVERGGRYQAQWSTTEGGKRIRKSETFILRGDAEWWLSEAERTGVLPETGQTTGEYLERWLRTVHGTVAGSTWTSYADHIRNQIIPRIGSIPVLSLAPRHIDDLLDQLKRAKTRHRRHPRTLSPTTVASIGTTLRMALAHGVNRGELRTNAARMVRLPRKAEHLTPALTDADAAAIVAAVCDTWLGPLTRLLMGSALRLGEACGLDQRDLFLDKGYVRVRRSKTRPRPVKVSGDAVEALRHALASAPRRGGTEPVFFSPRPNREGVRDRLAGSSVSHALPRSLERAGLGHLSPHALRHGVASIMLAHGTPMRDIAEQLGHRNPALTARVYAHVIPESLDRAVDLLDQAVRKR